MDKQQRDELYRESIEIFKPFMSPIANGVFKVIVPVLLVSSYFAAGSKGLLGAVATVVASGAFITFVLTRGSVERLLTAYYCVQRRSKPHDQLLRMIDEMGIEWNLFFGGNLATVQERLKAAVTDGCGCSTSVDRELSGETREVVAILDQVPGITKASLRDFKRSKPQFQLRDETTVRTQKNLLVIQQVFLADRSGRMVYGGYVARKDSEALQQALLRIQRDFT